MKNYIKIKNIENESSLLHFTYQNNLYRIEFLNTGFDSFKGTSRKNSPYSIRDQHIHSVFHLLMFSEGEYHYLHKGKRIKFKPGTFTITSPDEIHKFGPFRCSQLNSYYYVTFVLQEIKSGLELDIDFRKFMEIFSGEKISDITLPVQFNKRQMSIFQNLTTILTEQLNSTTKFNYFSAARTMIDIINFILNECCRSSESIDEKFDDFQIKKAKNFIEKNFSQQMSIDELSSIAALEPSYFIRKFKNTYQITPINYQMELKINAAKTLLKTTDLRINYIAERIGVNDIYYFSKLFKKITGSTPSEFRKNYHALKAEEKVATF